MSVHHTLYIEQMANGIIGCSAFRAHYLTQTDILSSRRASPTKAVVAYRSDQRTRYTSPPELPGFPAMCAVRASSNLATHSVSPFPCRKVEDRRRRMPARRDSNQ